MSLVRRPWFWIVFALVSAAFSALAIQLFPRAFPIVSLDIHMDRTHAIAAAADLAKANDWGPHDSVRAAASFGNNSTEQAFIELEGGGKPAYSALLHDDLFAPYEWTVRRFKEGETNQTVIGFKPGGEPYEFNEKLRERTPGAALAADRAREIAEHTAAAAPWHIPLDRYKPVETSQVKRPGGRVDHTFIYERDEPKLGEGRLRLRLVVSGDRLTALEHFVKIPEAFTRRYEHMRSANNAIATGAQVAMFVVYILGGCIGGLIYLMRQRAVLWRPALLWASLIAGLQLLAGLNAWPLEWLGYDTAVSASGFVTERTVALIANTLIMGIVFFLSFVAAEGLSRRAFPNQPQFWRIWSRAAAPTPAVLGRTVGGYLWAAVSLVYVLVFYFFTVRHFGWWTPSEALVDPNSLANYQPWLTPFAQAAQAGFWEESLFRAVPLAGAALLGSRFGGRQWWLAGAFLVQAVIFAAAHANYPGEPAYSRLVELIVPSFMFAGFYLLFGLLPGIVLHFTYDIALMSLPLFAASASGIWIDRALLVLVALIPLWIVLWRRLRAPAWQAFPADLRNAAWQPPPLPPSADVTATPFATVASVVSRRLLVGTSIAAVLGLVAWFVATPHYRLGPPLEIGRATAIRNARAALAEHGVKLDAQWHADATVLSRPETQDRFAWQTAGPDGYRTLLGRYIPNALWQVRFVTFEGDVAERAERWDVYLTGTGALDGISHQLPEARAGASLAEADARQKVDAEIRRKWQLDPAQLKEISATSAKRPKRVDWTFVFRDPSVTSLAAGQARLEVDLAGDEITNAYRFVFVPEDWERADRALQTNLHTGEIITRVVTVLLILTGIGVGIVAFSRKKLAGCVALVVIAVMAAATVVGALVRWPSIAAHFSTAQPLDLQRTITIVSILVGALFLSAGIGCLAGLVARWPRVPIADRRHASLLGVATGIVLAGGAALGGWLHAGTAPVWPLTAPAETFSPLLAPAVGAISPFFIQVSLLLLIFGALDRVTEGWQKQRVAACILAFLVLAVLSFDAGGDSLALCIVSAALSALVVLAAYVLVLRHDLTMLPLVKAATGALGALAAGLSDAYAGALPGALVAAATFAALGWWFTTMLRRVAAARLS
ncbi:MAG TPA: CPBP family intramembrane glutamic endopeptidase [Opitutus sp.]|nr:CPBP family intramembrane glutamic endopeptidase [Opitutus sp.]